jgi:ankyrin repeat protein
MGTNVNAGEGRYGIALQAASYHGNEVVVQLLLENGANINAEGRPYGNETIVRSLA